MTKELIKLEQQLISEKCLYKIKKHPTGEGFQIVIRFPNGYGASIVRFALGRDIFLGSYGSYTDNDSEVEIAILKFNSDGLDNFDLAYSTPITDDVLGHQTYEETIRVLQQIKELSPLNESL